MKTQSVFWIAVIHRIHNLYPTVFMTGNNQASDIDILIAMSIGALLFCYPFLFSKEYSKNKHCTSR